MTYLDETLAAAVELAQAARWDRAMSLLDAAAAAHPADQARIALTAAAVAVESDWFSGAGRSAERLAMAEKSNGDSWDLAFLRLRHDYLELLAPGGVFAVGPDGKDQRAVAELRDRADNLAASATGPVRHGWARMYRGLIADNLLGELDTAPGHYAVALAAGDDLLAREALRHLGGHDRDNGDLAAAGDRWERATALGARAGLLTGTLSQQMLLAVLARDTGDEAGAVRLATEIARWADAIGATRLRDQATAFVAGERVA